MDKTTNSATATYTLELTENELTHALAELNASRMADVDDGFQASADSTRRLAHYLIAQALEQGYEGGESVEFGGVAVTPDDEDAATHVRYNSRESRRLGSFEDSDARLVTDGGVDVADEADDEADDGSLTDADERFAVVVYHVRGGLRTREFRADLSTGRRTPEYADLFDRYDRVGVENDASLNDVWAAWNAGSGRESDAFRDAEVRSLMVGDVLVADGQAYVVASFGFDRVPELDDAHRRVVEYRSEYPEAFEA